MAELEIVISFFALAAVIGILAAVIGIQGDGLIKELKAISKILNFIAGELRDGK